jgi:Na+-transporting methylmalonyl-CoA/oxaloacetate decarboxylase gamma subunit
VLLLLSLLTLAITVVSMFIRPEWARAQVEELRNQRREKRG